jgi:alanine-synthesizing transaminase
VCENEPVFSGRIPMDLRPNAIARARGRREIPFDLTVSNPTACGIPYPESLLAPLSRPAGLVYRPEPLGIESARRAVAADCRRHGAVVDPGHVAIVASSSEAYSFLFKLLCEPGDAVLVPYPSYPLFEHLAALDGVRAVPYRLDPDDGWQPSLPAAMPDRARAIVAVHPNNPTGSYVEEASARSLARACARHGLALIADEVFLDYPLVRAEGMPSLAARAEALTFALGGLSKSLGLPQLKLSWIATSGPGGAVEEAVRRLEFIADSYLSVATPVQLALPLLLSEAVPVRGAILARCRENLGTLRAAAAAVPAVSVPPPQGGWSAVLRFPSTIDEEALALELLEQDGVAIHPGYFFDFPGRSYAVVSLLPEPAVFSEGAQHLLRRIAAKI